MEEKSVKYDAPAARTVVALIEVLCESEEPLGVSALAQKLGASQNMVFRVLQTLEQEKWVKRVSDGAKYAMTLLPFHYVSLPISRMGLVEAAEAPLNNFRKATKECVYLGVWHEDKVLYLIHHDGMRNVRIGGNVGEMYWPHASAPGKILLAYCDEAQKKHFLDGERPKLTRHTLTSVQAIRAELGRTRERGYAMDIQEYMDGGLCLAVAIRDAEGNVVASIGTTVLSIYYTADSMVEKLLPKLMSAAQEISETLGWENREEKP